MWWKCVTCTGLETASSCFWSHLILWTSWLQQVSSSLSMRINYIRRTSDGNHLQQSISAHLGPKSWKPMNNLSYLKPSFTKCSKGQVPTLHEESCINLKGHASWGIWLQLQCVSFIRRSHECPFGAPKGGVLLKYAAYLNSVVEYFESLWHVCDLSWLSYNGISMAIGRAFSFGKAFSQPPKRRWFTGVHANQ